MKYLNKIGMMVVAGLALATTSCSDYDDYNSVPSDINAVANKTLYENIAENGNLKDFAAIINKAGYQSALNSSQCYTLWAPLDGTYDAKAILDMSDKDIVKKFLKMHMAQFSHPVSGNVNERVISLNDKHHTFTNELFDDLHIQQSNVPATNGIMHIIDGISEYYPSIYEYLDEVEGCDSFVNHVQSYDIPEIDKKNSVEGPMVNGQQTYLDTVWTKSNKVIKEILKANIEDEDSSFTVLFPTNEAWKQAYERIRPLYKYVPKVNYMDVSNNTTPAASLKKTDAKAEKPDEIDAELYSDSLPKAHIMRNLAFTNTFKVNSPLLTGQLGTLGKKDTLISATRTSLSNVEEILSHCGELTPMSNGYVRTLDSLCFNPRETYEKIHSYFYPERSLDFKTNASYTVNTYGRDSLVEKHSEMFSELPDFIKRMMLPETSRFFSYISADSINLKVNSSRAEFDFALDDVLSTKYHIYVVFVPSQLKEPWRPVSEGKTEVKNTYVRFDLAYTNEKGEQDYQRLNLPGNKLADDILVVNDGKFHVVELTFTFPVCHYGLKSHPTLFVSIPETKKFTSTPNRRKYDQELRIAGVYLVPEGAYDYVQSLKF